MPRTQTPQTECPTCHAQPGQPCQTIYYIRQEDGSYRKNEKPTRTHKPRKG